MSSLGAYCEQKHRNKDMDWEMSFETNIWIRKRCFDKPQGPGRIWRVHTHKYIITTTPYGVALVVTELYSKICRDNQSEGNITVLTVQR